LEALGVKLGVGRQCVGVGLLVLLGFRNGRLDLASWLDSTAQDDYEIELSNSISEPDNLNV
jgi:hypothetical protein